MPVRLGRFELPKRLQKDEASASENYAKFAAEPFEPGYGHTIGNSLRRILLSSLEGAAITSVKIDGAMHEFTTVEGAVEDVTDIVLNLKKILFKSHSREPQTLLLSVNKEGEIHAGDIQLNQNIELVNPKQLICTLDKKKKLEMELEVKIGRGFLPWDENKSATASKPPASASAPITTGSSLKSGPMAASRRMTRSPRLQPSCSTTSTSSSVTTRTPSNLSKPSKRWTTRRPR
jgi:DNA-directed RNA polymerase alpha subunit